MPARTRKRTGQPLIIVESPTKARTIEKAFGRRYRVAASLGHLRDLPRSQLGVDVEADFEPRYITVRGRGEVVKQLRTAASRSGRTLLAADPDREGEAICWHLAQLLGLDPASPCRIVFHEITKEAVGEALRHPRAIDMDLVDAQQARRVLDRLVGYGLSPLLWQKVRRGLSAGRVQSVAVRLICDREAEIAAFKPVEYWTITATLAVPASDGQPATSAAGPPAAPSTPSFAARLVGRAGQGGTVEKVEIGSAGQAQAVVEESRRARWVVAGVKRGIRRRRPAPPFTTSTLQQEASHRLGFSVRRTMVLAQQLYEGVDLGEAGSTGLITYMRTDSARVAESARQQARRLVAEALGPEHVPVQPPRYRAGRRALEAHEAIRPSDPSRMPAVVKPFLSADQYRLYRLIWERFVASEMAPAVYATVAAEFTAGSWLYRSSGSEVSFRGFLAAAELAGADSGDGGREEPVAAGARAEPAEPLTEEEAAEEEKALSLPDLRRGDEVRLLDIVPERHFTSPPPRYSEATLVKAMEELGIGRPSTYAPTIETILARGYVDKEDGRLRPTKLGEVVTDLLLAHFPDVIDVAFTADMEDKLDRVEEGALPWRKVVRTFYGPFAAALKAAQERHDRVEVPAEETGILCEACGRPMVVKYGRYGKFLACSGYPECRQTKPYAAPTGAVCPKCGAEVVEKRTKKGRRFYGCIRYPECDFSVWSRPTERRCPECGTFLISVKGRLLRCANEACGYEEAGEPAGRDSPV